MWEIGVVVMYAELRYGVEGGMSGVTSGVNT